jgi:hypothetical protein
MGESGLAPVPTAGYGGVLFLSGLAFTILVRTILACQPPESVLATAIGSDRKGNLSLALYAAAIPLTFINSWIAVALVCLSRADVVRSGSSHREPDQRHDGMQPHRRRVQGRPMGRVSASSLALRPYETSPENLRVGCGLHGQ